MFPLNYQAQVHISVASVRHIEEMPSWCWSLLHRDWPGHRRASEVPKAFVLFSDAAANHATQADNFRSRRQFRDDSSLISPKHVDMFLIDLPCAGSASTRPCAGSRLISSIRHDSYEIDAILCHAQHPKKKTSTEMKFCRDRLPTWLRPWHILPGATRMACARRFENCYRRCPYQFCYVWLV